MKPGMKIKSSVCDTEVMIIKGTNFSVNCGGAPMSDAKAEGAGEVDPNFANGTQVGKRYVNSDGSVELLCVKAGKGSLSIDGQELPIKDSKPLPSSD